MNNTVLIGDKFRKPLSKNKSADCEITDIVQRISVKTGKIISSEYWAVSTDFNFQKSFEVAKSTVVMNRI